MITSAVLEEHLIIQQLCLEMKSTQCQTERNSSSFITWASCVYTFWITLGKKKDRKILDLALCGFPSRSLRRIFRSVDAPRLLRLGCTSTDGLVLNFWRPKKKKNSFSEQPVSTRLFCHGGGLVTELKTWVESSCFQISLRESRPIKKKKKVNEGDVCVLFYQTPSPSGL